MERRTELDSVDWAILERLQNDATIQNKDLAAAVGVAQSTCLERVRRLRSGGVIVGYRAEVSPAAVGLGLEAMIAVQVRPHSRELFGKFVDFALDLPETRALYHVSGPEDFLVHVAVADTRDLQRIVLDVMASRPEVAHVQSFLVYEQAQMSALGRPTASKDLPTLINPRAQARKRSRRGGSASG